MQYTRMWMWKLTRKKFKEQGGSWQEQVDSRVMLYIELLTHPNWADKDPVWIGYKYDKAFFEFEVILTLRRFGVGGIDPTKPEPKMILHYIHYVNMRKAGKNPHSEKDVKEWLGKKRCLSLKTFLGLSDKLSHLFPRGYEWQQFSLGQLSHVETPSTYTQNRLYDVRDLWFLCTMTEKQYLEDLEDGLEWSVRLPTTSSDLRPCAISGKIRSYRGWDD